MAQKQGTPLTSLSGFPATITNQLAAAWITTAEEFYAIALQPDSIQGLAQLLHISEAEVLDLKTLAEAIRSPALSYAVDEIEPHGLGALEEPEELASPDDEWATATLLPPQIDLHHRLGSVRNQGSRGTCVAHASVAIREYLAGEESIHTDLSEQFLYWCCKQRDHRPDGGTLPAIAVACLREIGVCEEHVWAYNPDIIQGNEGQGPPPEGAAASAAYYRIHQAESFSARSIYHIREKVASGQPIIFTIPVYVYWQVPPVYYTGDIRLPLPFDRAINQTATNKRSLHAMCIVGYTDDLSVPGGGYFLVRNSWGVAWANLHVPPGYCRIPYEYCRQHAMNAYTFALTT